ncbi:hypothetical protein PENARI_c081G12066 [Penicillium arizonense]|uniref:6-phosphogluconate dehydrogenase NADP-binding domain-containing protein n=1 Tax=Penicillium arizonense TaxID=1835702 RepID=A0A1F5L1A3_PENAI|nr:hypothetical protein PENARI_c081G12066 [Penicillium arizonense]OGE46975.1 hypothetical protein PENARI_c081G12066 [Penicillium arizonense]
MEGHYAVIGLGAMGYGMASNLRKNIPLSSTLFVYDVDRAVCDKFKIEFSGHGPIETNESIKETVEYAHVLVSSLPSLGAVRDVYLDGATGVLAARPNPNRLIVETSTMETSSATEVAQKLAEAKAGYYVDAPVSGGPPGAAAGTLSFMIGHAKPELSDLMSLRLQRLLTIMGNPKKLFWCGKLGTGLAAKISNNYIACTVFIAVAEAMAIGVRSGIDGKLLRDIINSSSGQTAIGDIVTFIPKDQLLGPNGFPVHIMVKDIALGVNAAELVDVAPKMALTALEIWKQAEEVPEIIAQDGIFHA